MYTTCHSKQREYQGSRRRNFAALTGANVAFSPAHAKEWMIFWKTDICEKDEYHTWFPQLSLGQAQRVWLAMEERFFGQYDYFLRVWPSPVESCCELQRSQFQRSNQNASFRAN